LKLDLPEGRKLAPLQAYCSYEWDAIQPEVIARWELQKKSATFDDEDDPPATIGPTSPEAFIPLSFKLKVVKEFFDKLTPEERKALDRRREEDRHKVHRKIPEITVEKERIEKLQAHARYRNVDQHSVDFANSRLFRNQQSVANSVIRALENLEDQAGCVAHLFVASVDPESGVPTLQKYVRSPVIHITY